jgi:hypothetical protein
MAHTDLIIRPQGVAYPNTKDYISNRGSGNCPFSSIPPSGNSFFPKPEGFSLPMPPWTVFFLILKVFIESGRIIVDRLLHFNIRNMNRISHFTHVLCIIALLGLSISSMWAQEGKSKKGGKETEQTGLSESFLETETLINSRQFVFEVEQEKIYYIVDSSYSEIQSKTELPKRGSITHWKVKKNEKRKNLSISYTFRHVGVNYEVFLTVDENGRGKLNMHEESRKEIAANMSAVEEEPPAEIYQYGGVVDFEKTKAIPWNTNFK